MTVFGNVMLISIDFFDFNSTFFLMLRSIIEMFQTLQTASHRTFKPLKVDQKYCIA